MRTGETFHTAEGHGFECPWNCTKGTRNGEQGARNRQGAMHAATAAAGWRSETSETSE